MATNPSPLRGLINSETAAGEDWNVGGLSDSSLGQTDFRTAGRPVVVDCDPTLPDQCAERRLRQGRRLFDAETFGGNGRMCRTCHSKKTGTFSPEEAQARLAEDPSDPLSFTTALTMALLERAGSPNTRPSGSKSGCLPSYSRMIDSHEWSRPLFPEPFTCVECREVQVYAQRCVAQ
jgi:hypothetical protein